MILTAKELMELTLRRRPAAQARVLTNMGIPFHVHPADRVLLVSRAAVATKLGAISATVGDSPLEYEVDTLGMKCHGKTTPKH